MAIARFVPLLLSLSYAVTLSAAEPSELADSFIAEEVARIGGTEYKPARSIVHADENKPGAISFAVLYSIEGIDGGNNVSQFLVAFLMADGQFMPTGSVRVGGRGYRSVDLDKVESNRVQIRTLNYLPSDPSSHPSLKGESVYWLQEGRLAEGVGLRFTP